MNCNMSVPAMMCLCIDSTDIADPGQGVWKFLIGEDLLR